MQMFGQLLTKLRGSHEAKELEHQLSIEDYAVLVKDVLEDLEVPSTPERQDEDEVLWMTTYGSAILLTSLYTEKTAGELV